MDTSLTAGLVGAAFGILGGIAGTYFSIHNTKTPTERRFMVLASIGIWVGVSGFLGLLFLLPSAWRWVAWLLYAVILPLAIRDINRRQKALRDPDGDA